MMEQLGSLSDSSSYLLILSKDQVSNYMQDILPLLEKGRRSWGEYETLAAIQLDLMSGIRQLWIYFEDTKPTLCIISEIAKYSSGLKVLNIQYIMGLGFFKNKKILSSFLHIVNVFAAEGKCDKVCIRSKLAFEPILKDWGFLPTAVNLEKNVIYTRKER